MKIAIVDDELIFAQSFRNILEKRLFDTMQLLNIFTDTDGFIASKRKYDIVFLDIEMPKITGLELAKKYKNENTYIVFVTNRDDLVFEAYNTTNSLGFIRKTHLEKDLNVIIQRMHKEFNENTCISIKDGDSLVKIRSSDIRYIEKIAHNVILHTADTSLSMRKSMSETEEMLKPHGFFRVHAGYIVNLDHIALIRPTEILLQCGSKIPVSRKNLKLVKNEFLRRSVYLNE